MLFETQFRYQVGQKSLIQHVAIERKCMNMDELEPANVGYLFLLCCSKSWLNSKSQTPPPAICKTMQKPVSFAEFSRNEREKI